MHYTTLPVKNVARLSAAGELLINRDYGMPGMGLIYGETGYGKTTAAAWYVNQCDGVYIRAMRLWSPKSMLTTMARELELDTKGKNNGELVETVIQRLGETGRPLFIDEADYVIESRRLADTLRDIHDLSTVPVILIGKKDIRKHIKDEQISGRIAQWVEFRGADMADARLLADGLCEVTICDDLLEHLHAEAQPKGRNREALGGAEIRRMVVGLGQIEQFARSRGLEKIGAAEWTRGDDFFLGAAATPASTAPSKGGKVTSIKRS